MFQLLGFCEDGELKPGQAWAQCRIRDGGVGGPGAEGLITASLLNIKI